MQLPLTRRALVFNYESPFLATVKKQVHTLLFSNLLPLPDNPNIMTLELPPSHFLFWCYPDTLFPGTGRVIVVVV